LGAAPPNLCCSDCLPNQVEFPFQKSWLWAWYVINTYLCEIFIIVTNVHAIITQEVDELSLFHIDEHEGVIKLSVDTTQALKFDEANKEVIVRPYESEQPEFHFRIDFI